MTTFALVLDGAILERRDFGLQAPPILVPNKGVWLPAISEPPPAHEATQVLAPFTTIAADAVTDGWTVRDKNAAELAAERAARVAAIDTRLAEIDLARTRPLEELAIAWLDSTEPSAAAVTRLRDLAAEAEALRAERAGLVTGGGA